MARPGTVLSLVERGWQAARECSLELGTDGVLVVHLIKGSLDAGVCSLIAPRPTITIRNVSKELFWVAVWWLSIRLIAAGRLRALLVDNDRSLRLLRGWARLIGCRLALVRPGASGYELWMASHRIARGALID